MLYQLPPGGGRWISTASNIFCAPCRAANRHTVEFRETSWYDDRVYALLEKHHVALCLHDMQGSATQRMVVGPFIYVRFHHGTSKYTGRYADERLDEWADWLADASAGGSDVFAYFNNDSGGHAPRDAVRLRDRIHERLLRPTFSPETRDRI